MWTDESRTGDLIMTVSASPIARRILYQSQMHMESFQHSRDCLHESFETLLFRDFAISRECSPAT